MKIARREIIGIALALSSVAAAAPATDDKHMYGLIVKITAIADQRDALINILVKSATTMPGCFSYIVAKDAQDPDALWVTEVWDSKQSHDASLNLPQVKEAIAAGKPLIAAFGNVTVTNPIGGQGLSAK